MCDSGIICIYNVVGLFACLLGRPGAWALGYVDRANGAVHESEVHGRRDYMLYWPRSDWLMRKLIIIAIIVGEKAVTMTGVVCINIAGGLRRPPQV